MLSHAVVVDILPQHGMCAWYMSKDKKQKQNCYLSPSYLALSIKDLTRGLAVKTKDRSRIYIYPQVAAFGSFSTTVDQVNHMPNWFSVSSFVRL